MNIVDMITNKTVLSIRVYYISSPELV